MEQYHKLLNDILNRGAVDEDRTGTGKISLFGHQYRFDLREGFPLQTTKKLHLRSIVHELIWFLAGCTDTDYLNDHAVHIWDDWVKGLPDNKSEHSFFVEMPNDIESKSPIRVKVPKIPTEQRTFLRDLKPHWLANLSFEEFISNEAVAEKSQFFRDVALCLWNEIMSTLEGAESDVTLDSSFVLNKDKFHSFLRDLTVQLMRAKCRDPFHEYVAIPTFYGIKHWSKGTAVIIRADHRTAIENNLVAVSKTMGYKTYRLTNDASKYPEDMVAKNYFVTEVGDYVYRTITDTSLGPIYGEQWRGGTDQIANVIQQLKDNPTSRRMVVDSWSPSQLNEMALPPCHCLFQFYSEKCGDDQRYLDLQLYQRSQDVPLGGPFNIAQYAMLLVIIATVTDHIPRNLIITLGDAHIYLNQIEGVKEILSREPRALPTFKWTGFYDEETNTFTHGVSDFIIEGYNPHPPVHMPVSV